MFGLLTIVSSLLTAKQLVKEKMEKPVPKGTRFDWDAYYKDIENGISVTEQIKKIQAGGYNTTKPATPKWYELPMDAVVDIERYEHDKKIYSESTVRHWKEIGSYREIRTF